MFGIVRVLKQIEVEQKVSDEERSEEDYSIRGYPNHILRWSLMLLLVILHFVRIFYFVQGYFLLTFVFGLFFFERLHNHLYTTSPCVGATSDWFYTSHYSSSGDLLWLEPRVCALFSHKLSPDDFTSFVNRILEFKFWYFTGRMVVLVFLLTWIPLLKCSFVGPNVLFLWIIPDALEYADSIKKKLLSYLDKDAPTLRVKLEVAMQRLTNLGSVQYDMEPICVLNHVFGLREYMRECILWNSEGDSYQFSRQMSIIHLAEQHVSMDLTQGIREVLPAEVLFICS